MSRFSTAFQEVAADPRGEALRTKLYVRLNDGAGGAPSTLVELTASHEIISIGQIVQKREHQWGVVRGQAWQVRLDNANLGLLAYDLVDCWCALQIGFEVADEWDLGAQGKIQSVTPSGDGTVTLEVYDGLMDLLQFTLPRDIMFQSTSWVSGIKEVEKANGSGTYDEDTSLTLAGAPLYTEDETFYIEFVTGVSFKIILEDGDESQTGGISTNTTVTNVAGDTNIITIPSSGWTGTFSAGDRFVFYTARPRTATELSPVGMVAHLIDDVAELSAYDVITGAAYSSPRFNTTNWTTESSEYSACEIGGYFDKGTSIAELVQDALKIVHGSIFPTHTGQIGIWVMRPTSEVSVELNGDPDVARIDILDYPIKEESLEYAVNQVTFEYLTLDGVSATVTRVDDDTPYSYVRDATVSIVWRVAPAYVETACSRYLTRFRLGRQLFTIPTTLKGILAEIGTAVNVNEPMVGLSTKNLDVIETGLQPLTNALQIKCYVDYATYDGYFRLGDAGTTPVGNQLGPSGSTGAAPIW